MALYQAETLAAEYASAFKTTRRVRMFLLALVLACILAILACAILVIFVDVLDLKPAKAPAASPTSNAATATSGTATTGPRRVASGAKTKEQIESAARWRAVLASVLTLSRVIAPTAAALAAVVLLLTINLTFLGRTGGVSAYISGFIWTVLLVAILVPWQMYVPKIQVPGVCVALAELKTYTQQAARPQTATLDHVALYARFVACPFIALLVWVLILVKCIRGDRRLRESTTVGSSSVDSPAPPQAREPSAQEEPKL